MARNLVLVFGLALAGALLVDHGAKVFAGTLGGAGSSQQGAPADATAGLSPAVPGAIGAVTPAMLKREQAKYGWGADQLGPWQAVIKQESGGDPTAVNPSSKAFGIGQFLGATLQEYIPFGAGSHDPGAQLAAMGRYIHDRYGSPAAAWAHEQQFNWY